MFNVKQKTIEAVFIIVVTLSIFLLYSVVTTPFSWFSVNHQYSRSEVYAQCGKPHSTDLWDIKGEYWKDKSLFLTWQMMISFNYRLDKVSHSDIWLDIGPEGYNLRLYIIADGKLNLHL